MLQRLIEITGTVVDAAESAALAPVRALGEFKVPEVLNPGRLVDAIGLLLGTGGSDLLGFLGPDHPTRVARLVPLVGDLSPSDLDLLLQAFVEAAAIAGVTE